MGKEFRKQRKKLLKENLYDFVGTDTHHHNHLKLLNKIGNIKIKKQISHLLENNKRFV